ncbi:hypothetical protein LCGC14_1890330 [marine sediment metagenome]|uniref:Uncharacterized protein n=1 Tax=marine sediment metagenome TaxID=412755 RepID=A0A0F9IDL8_9ZZZZ
MPRYLLMCPVDEAEGTQTYSVEAVDEAEALELHNQGQSQFVDEEVLATKLGKPKVLLDD